MLRVNLNNHSGMFIPPESPFIIHLMKKYENKKKINVNEFIQDLRLDIFLHVWKIDYQGLAKRLEQIEIPTFQNFCAEVLNQQNNNNILLGDKNPINSLFGDKLHRIFPNAKFIWIIRDYRAQVNSMLKVNFERKIISSLAMRWVSYNKEIQSLKDKYPNNVILIKYEDLVENPEVYYTKICNFLTINFEPEILNTAKHKKEFYPKHHASLEDQINTKHIDEWKNELTKKQIKICEAVAGKYGEQFGYQKTTTYSSFPFFGILYGKLYISFIKTMYSLPINIRTFINYKIIYRNSTFWKEAINYFENKNN